LGYCCGIAGGRSIQACWLLRDIQGQFDPDHCSELPEPTYDFASRSNESACVSLQNSMHIKMTSNVSLRRSSSLCKLQLDNLTETLASTATRPERRQHPQVSKVKPVVSVAAMAPKPVRDPAVSGAAPARQPTEDVEVPSPLTACATGPSTCSGGIITHSNPPCKCITCDCKRSVRRRDTNLCDYCYSNGHFSPTGS